MITKRKLMKRVEGLESHRGLLHERIKELNAKELVRCQKEGQRFRAVTRLADCIELQDRRIVMLEKTVKSIADELGLDIKFRDDYPEIEIVKKEDNGPSKKG